MMRWRIRPEIGQMRREDKDIGVVGAMATLNNIISSPVNSFQRHIHSFFELQYSLFMSGLSPPGKAPARLTC